MLPGKAFRSAMVMAWNLAYDHLLRWLLADPARLQTFNQRIPARYPKKQVQIAKFDDFEDLKESEVIEVASSAGLLNGNVVKVLDKELKRRNSAAHPSPTVFTQYQAEDAITDLVNNVVLGDCGRAVDRGRPGGAWEGVADARQESSP